MEVPDVPTTLRRRELKETDGFSKDRNHGLGRKKIPTEGSADAAEVGNCWNFEKHKGCTSFP